MKLDRKNVRTILLIIAFAVLLYTAAQNLASVYGGQDGVEGLRRGHNGPCHGLCAERPAEAL